MDLISRAWLKEAIHNFFNGLSHKVTEEDIQTYIEATPSAFEGMTNEEVMKAVFGKSYADIDSYIYGSKDVEIKQWCRSPYKG